MPQARRIHRSFMIRLRTIAFIVRRLTELESGPQEASSPARSEAIVIVADPVLSGRFEADAPARLREAVAHGIERSGTEATRLRHAAGPLDCDTPSCFAHALEDAGGAHLVTTRVNRRDRDYAIEVELRDREGELVARKHQACEICGIGEAIEAVASA